MSIENFKNQPSETMVSAAAENLAARVNVDDHRRATGPDVVIDGERSPSDPEDRVGSPLSERRETSS